MRTTISTALLVLASFTAISCHSPTAASSTVVPARLVDAVTAGGYVLFFRHAARDASALSTGALAEADRAGECVPGSELTEQGRADSLEIGAAFQRRGIKVNHVYISPTCRTREMATLAFGKHETTAGLAWPDMWTGDDAETYGGVLKELLGTPPPPGSVNVLIAHSSILVPSRIGMDIPLDQADAAVFRPLGNNAFRYIGRIPKSEWSAPAAPGH